jgi:hypothetical protein
MTFENDDLIAQLAASGRLDAAGSRVPVPLRDLPEHLRPFAQIADELQNVGRHAGAPPLEEDRAARLLGLVPSADKRLDGRQLRAQRQRCRRTVSDIANDLRQRGWEFTPADIMRWENSDAIDVPPVVIDSLATLLATSADELAMREPAVKDDVSVQLRGSARFASLATRWARVQKVTIQEARAALESRALSTVHRGARTDVDDTLASMEALVRALEKRAGL